VELQLQIQWLEQAAQERHQQLMVPQLLMQAAVGEAPTQDQDLLAAQAVVVLEMRIVVAAELQEQSTLVAVEVALQMGKLVVPAVLALSLSGMSPNALLHTPTTPSPIAIPHTAV